MSLCYREQRQLRGIEADLFRSDSHLAGMLETFGRYPGPPRRGWHPCPRSRVLFASLPGYKPGADPARPVLAHLHPAQAAFLTSRSFFPPCR
jgi:hypothetical protein